MTRAWGLTRLILTTVLVALATPLFAAPSAEADVAACASGPEGGFLTVDGSVFEGVLNDRWTLGADSLTGLDPYTDTENGIRNPAWSWEDGPYYAWINMLCLTTDTNGPADDGSDDTGLYGARMILTGAYDNTICGTGLWIDRGPGDSTTLDLTPIAALGPGEDIWDAKYTLSTVAGTGPIVINATTTPTPGAPGGEPLAGGGAINLTPVFPSPGDCVTRNVRDFAMTGMFTLIGVTG